MTKLDCLRSTPVHNSNHYSKRHKQISPSPQPSPQMLRAKLMIHLKGNHAQGGGPSHKTHTRIQKYKKWLLYLLPDFRQGSGMTICDISELQLFPKRSLSLSAEILFSERFFGGISAYFTLSNEHPRSDHNLCPRGVC